MTSTHINQQPATILAWLTQRGVTGVPKHRIARALGISPAEVDSLLSVAPTVDALLNLNRLAQYRHLALAVRVWPNCTWLAWENKRQGDPPVIDLIRRMFGRELLDYVENTFGRDVVLQHWSNLEVPPQYQDIPLDDDDGDPLDGVPGDQIVDNPHLSEEEVGEMFVFGHPATAACFRWLIESRHSYSHYVDNRTSYTNDPLGVQLAYDLRRSLRDGYWASLPPDTLPAWLAIVQALQDATVPEPYQEGSLPPLYTTEAATLPTDLLHIVHIGGDDEIWLHGPDGMVFDRQPVHVFVFEPDTEQVPAAVILTTEAEPGNPEHHRDQPPLRYLHRSHETEQLAFVRRDQMERVRENIHEVEDVLMDTLDGVNYALDADSGIFCMWRYNPGAFGSLYENAIAIYRIPGGYMLQFDPEYSFAPDEMAVG